VAGCGTGYQAIHCALHYRNSQVTGVDLSLSSLAYGKRMAEEMKVANVAFIQGDLLDLEKVPGLFDLIECTGVLHHMSDPLAGWSILANILADDGWMHIGQYSEIARKKIAPARQYVNQKGYEGSQEEIRLCRQEIINSQDCDPVKTVVLWEDFYSMSTCRDLLFHVHEVHFTLLQIAEILKKLNLKFAGLDVLPSTKSRFIKMFPNDPFMVSLENWHEFEQAFPDTFATMYSFWVKKLH
jgi:SAM-dependent methyltransferase